MPSEGEGPTELEKEIFGSEDDEMLSQASSPASGSPKASKGALGDSGDFEGRPAKPSRQPSRSASKRPNKKATEAPEGKGAEGLQPTDKIMEARKDFDEALERTKTAGRRGQRVFDIGEPVDLDEIALKFVRKMTKAVGADHRSSEEEKPALERQKILPEVIDMLTKKHFQEVLLDNGVLEAVRRWLEPMPDRTIPAPHIRKALLETLKTIPIETVHLRESGIGKIINFFSQRPNELADIRRLSNELIATWSRPVLQRSSTHSRQSDVRNAPAQLQSEAFRKAHRRFPVAVESSQQKKIVQSLARKKSKQPRF